MQSLVKVSISVEHFVMFKTQIQGVLGEFRVTDKGI